MTWAFLTTPIARAIAKIGGVILAVLTFGAYQRHRGAQAARDKQAAADAKADQEAHERINNADTGADLDDDARAERLREFAAKHGNRPSKAGGGKVRRVPR